MSERIQIKTLTDGGQQPAEIAHQIAEFLDGAQKTLDLAQYDFNLGPETKAIVSAAFERAAARGVRIRLAYNIDHASPIPVPPPPEPDVKLIATLPLQSKGIAGIPDLMHHKYVIRDEQTVWTGTMNWTDDSWSRQENVIAIVDSHEIAVGYQIDFDQLWATGDVMKSGFVDPRWDDDMRAWFTPGHGEDLSMRIAKRIRNAKVRVRICSPVITTPPVLTTLAEIVAEKKPIDLAGCVDATQVQEVIYQWHAQKNVAWKLPLLRQVMAGPFTGKPSTPYADGSVHDFMHAKVTVCDDTVFVGSFNLSRSGERNAENVVELNDAAIADELAAFVDHVRALYKPVELPTFPMDQVAAAPPPAAKA